MGESPERVFTVGEVGLDNLSRMTFLSREDFEKAINHKLKKKYSFYLSSRDNSNYRIDKERFSTNSTSDRFIKGYLGYIYESQC